MAPTTTSSDRALAPFSVELGEEFTPAWNRIDGITVEGKRVTIDPRRYFFRLENPTWRVIAWEKVRDELLIANEGTEVAVEQLALDFIRAHAEQTSEPARVLEIGYQVAAHLFREEYLDEPGLNVTPTMLKALREATAIMALNKVELDGHISNVGPCWFFPIATEVVYGLPHHEAEALDELYHGAWFNEYRRRESILAHAALGGRLVHGCQAQADMKGGCVVAYGTDLDGFRADLEAFDALWTSRVLGMRA
ncbi:hypothetical protein HII36_47305 [Nonomuraea sp. NN258]|uniref:hypothetical protein n=1 Tax=Nonomuraea antri TaxID=2730852 RepID=UPI0015693A60|nr:hypothetical protein [Nonomuraea antri]NRQ39383.1 hypothetical protein [Nonomuraea antri]